AGTGARTSAPIHATPRSAAAAWATSRARERNASMPSANGSAWLRWLALSAAVVALDLATKAWVSAAFQYGEVRPVLPFFNLVLVHNTGAAFSFLAGAGGWQRWFFTAVTILISTFILVLLRRHHN